MNAPAVCLLGLGEVGQVLACDLAPRVGGLCAWDSQFVAPGSAPRRAAERLGVRAARDLADALRGADLVISAVTAANCVAAARAAAAHLAPGAWYVDLNSVAPGSRREAAQFITQAQGRFVEVAVMSPILPQRLASPLLLGGERAVEARQMLRDLGFTEAQVFSTRLGEASAAKMCRSVVIKGMETLLLESLLTARHFGVEATVLESLQSWLGPGVADSFAHYMLGRAVVHGQRRAEEMREAADSVREAGLPARMSEACAQWQSWAAGRTARPEDLPLPELLDHLRLQAREVA